MLANLKNRAALLKREAFALVIAARDPRTPRYAKAFMGLVIAHTFSPIDLIPDFIPVLGLLDDLLITPLGIALSMKMIPSQVLVDARRQAEAALQGGEPVSRVGAAMAISLWLLALVALAWWLLRLLQR